MKKITAIASIALGLGIIFSTAVSANAPMQSEISLEQEITIQDWMLSFEKLPAGNEAGVENELRLESWMLDTNWSLNQDEVIAEAEIPLEDWMTKSFGKDNVIIALGF